MCDGRKRENRRKGGVEGSPIKQRRGHWPGRSPGSESGAENRD